MTLKDLTENELAIVKQCMMCVADGKVILHDWEFHSIMGVGIDEFLEILALWPNINENEERVKMAINNSLNNLIGYSHGKQKSWDRIMEAPISEIESVLQKWSSFNVRQI